MITKAKVVLQHGKTSTDPVELSDSCGIAVGKKYMLNLDGKTVEWTITRIVDTFWQNGQ